MPLAADGPATTGALASHRRRFSAYTWSEAFLYPFRGSGAYVFWTFPAVIVLLSIITQLPIVGLLAGCIQLLALLAVLFILPGALFAIVRETARGENELPEWPDLSEFGERLSEVFEFILVAMVALIPTGLLVRVIGCTDQASFTAFCWIVGGLASVVSIAIWLPAFGSVGAFRSFFLSFRFDLHARAVAACPGIFSRILAAALALVLVGQAVAFALLLVIPMLGIAVSAVVGLYSWFTIAHLVGLWFRWHQDELREIYLGELRL